MLHTLLLLAGDGDNRPVNGKRPRACALDPSRYPEVLADDDDLELVDCWCLLERHGHGAGAARNVSHNDFVCCNFADRDDNVLAENVADCE
jgi:hypothetical protein